MEKEAECGEKWRGSFVKYDPDLSLWKTHQCSLLGDLEEFLEIWPQWGLMRDGECWEQQMLAQTISETEYGLSENWPTPRSCSAMAATITPESVWNDKRNPNLETIVGKSLWPTPVYSEARQGLQIRREGKKGSQQSLTTAVMTWPTPRAFMHKDSTVDRGKFNLGEKVGGQLNPTWVEWLMGWPLGWTDLKPLETDKSLFVQQQPGES
jgi:hypothetical protein